MHDAVRPAAVAGMFYAGNARALARDVEALLAEVSAAGGPAPKAMLVPHAGYMYSGPVAAHAYQRLAPARETVRRVVLLGPAHRVALRGLALSSATGFETPLGTVAIERELADRLADLPQVGVNDEAHAPEHSLEVQLPFLQQTLGEFTLLPLVVGHASPEAVAEVLERVWGGPETLILISSDLSHYLPYPLARQMDQESVQMILRGEAALSHEQACGGTPLNGLLLAAARRGLGSELLDLRNSGDTAGDRSRVVGYCAIAFMEPRLGARDHGPALLAMARAAIANRLGRETAAPEAAPWCREQGATFVTLTQAGRLRGCIGTLEAHRSLCDDVTANALAAAFRDPRFPPLEAVELDRTRVEVSLLSATEPLSVRDEADAVRQLRPHIDGIIVEHAGQRATFLPQVWAQLPDRQAFLTQLKLKARVPADFWAADVKLARYTVSKWMEAPVAAHDP